eukprot:jgi/Astpho2/9844/gw1.00149.216.1_t
MEQEVVEAVLYNDVIMLCGETGCGKTTQVPQFLFEAGFGCKQFPERKGMIGVTQPRRVAAISTATRVADELASDLGDVVGYQVRYDRHLSAATAVKFMTDGILLRELQEDFLLCKYSVLIIDEAHERSLNTDLLLGLLSRVVALRRSMSQELNAEVLPLKLLIMSATLQVEELTANKRLFPSAPPVVRVPARQFPVTVHFNRRTEVQDYPGAAFQKVCRIHRQLPLGGVLVFLTGQREVEHLCHRLRQTFESRQARRHPTGAPPTGSKQPPAGIPPRTAAAAAAAAVAVQQPAAVSQAQRAAEGGALDEERGPGPVHVLPLYANLPRSAQARVFAAVPPGHRLIVVATNVAETSLTIPGIRYVVDAGRSKQKLLAEGGGLSKFEVHWISKAAALQRTGRAGRVGPGHCYRLYSSAHFNDSFPDNSLPEIATSPLEGVVLLMKAMAVDKVLNFPFPTPPSAAALRAAQQCLVALGALHPQTHLTAPLGLTALGREMARFPVGPRHAKMLLQVGPASKGPSQVAYGIALAAALSVEDPFMQTDNLQVSRMNSGDEEAAKRQRQSARGRQARLRSSHGDALSALNALCAFEAAGRTQDFCRQHYLHLRNLQEASALRRQLALAVLRQRAATGAPEETAQRQRELGELMQPLPSPRALIAQQLRKALAAGWADQVARRVRSNEYLAAQQEEGKKRGKHALRYRACAVEGEVFLHPATGVAAAAPEFVVYTQLVQTIIRPYMRGVTEIEAGWLAEVAQPLCSFSEPLPEPPPGYSAQADAVLSWRAVTFGSLGWELPPSRAWHPHAEERAAAFGAALLEGNVLPALKGLNAAWVLPPSALVVKDQRGQKRVGELVAALMRHSIDSHTSLAAAWRHKPRALQAEIGLWLPKQQHRTLEALWVSLLA